MKKIYALIFGLLFMPMVAKAQDPAIEFVDDLADKIITNVLQAKVSREEKLERFRADFTTALDLKQIGQFVLGVYWRKATAEEKDAFIDAFIDFTTKVWADRFDMYQGQKIVFSSVRNADKNQYYVNSTIENNPPVEVIWRLKQKDGKYRIVDIIVEGVSMAMSYRNEYSAFLQTNGGSVATLTKELQNKSENFKWSDKKSK